MNKRSSQVTPRREFLRQISMLLAAGTLAAELPWLAPIQAAPPGDSPSDRVRLGLIGPGSRGSYLLEILLGTPGVEVAGLCDDYKPHLEAAAGRCGPGARCFGDYRDLLACKDIDAVVITTPLHEHARMCLDAFSAGKHVFCEKSLAYTVAECTAVARAAKTSGLVFQIGHQRLYSQRYLRAFELIERKEIGPITMIRGHWHRNGDWRRPVPSPKLERKVNWRLYREYSAGLSTELASHHLQIANWFLKGVPLSCVGYGSVNYWKDGRELADNMGVVFKYPDGVHVLWDSVISNAYHGCEFQVLCREGYIETETGRLFLENPPPAPGFVQLVNGLERGLFEKMSLGGASWAPDLKKDTKGSLLDEDWTEPDAESKLQMAAFANAVRERRPIPGMVEHAYYSGVASLMAQFAVEERREIFWPAEATI